MCTKNAARLHLKIPCALFVLSMLMCTPPCFSEGLLGAVVDPQQRVIVGADVTLSCGGKAEHVKTDPQGRFVLSVSPVLRHCSLQVSHPGFESFEQLLDGTPAPLSIVLHLPVHKEEVNVTPKPQDLRELMPTWVGSASVSDRELQGISNNTEDLIRYAKALAGADMATDAIYVDGLPSGTLPPPEMVARIDVNTNPFSAEYSDPGQSHINIITKNADRTVHFNLGGNGFTWGGQNVLAPGLQSTTHASNLGFSGPVPNLPFTFSVRTNLSSSQIEQPIEAVTAPGQPSGPGWPKATVSNQSESGQVNIHYSPAETFHTDFSYSQLQSAGSNVGVGGETLPEAGSGSQLKSREARFTFTKAGTAFLWRGGMDFTESASQLQANSAALGVTVAGSFVAGGAGTLSSQTRRTNWVAKNVIESKFKQHLWTAGLIVTRSGDSAYVQPNPAGVIQFSSLQSYADSLEGSPTGTLFLSRGNGQIHYASIQAAPFLQGDLLHLERVLIVGGLRADYQAGYGVVLSPRLSLAARLAGFVLRGGAGIFAHNLPSGVLLHTIQDDGFHLRPYILQNVSVAAVQVPLSPADLESGPWVRSRLSPDLARPREYMYKASVERPLGAFVPGVEYTWSDGRHLLGSERLSDPAGWVDVLESNRGRQRQQVNARLKYTWKGQGVVAHYEWIQSRDNTAGPFSFPEYPGNLAAEWARTAGVSPHNFTAVVNLRLPSKISASVIATARSSAPYNITSGLDNGNGLYNDRDGRPRNSGNGPGYKSLDLYASRRILVPGMILKSAKRVHMNVGVRGNNLLNNRNYISLDSVLGSPLFGKPLAASPSRSVQCWVSID